MELQRQEKLKITALIVLATICIVLTSYLYIFNSSRQPTGTDEESLRGSEATESALQYLEIKNYELLEEKLPSIADTIPDQILQHHYNHTSKLERSAEITGGVETSGKNYRMTILFPASDTSYRVVINIKNLAVQDYSLDIEEIK